MRSKGFSLIEIILAIAISLIIFTFVFYFLTTISTHKDVKDIPRLLDDFNYTNNYCQLNDDYENISIYKDIELGEYISTSTIITSINIYNKDTLILTTNSASTTESDIFLFNISNMHLIKSINTGPGIIDSILHDDYLYVLNSSVNSHIQTFLISNNDLNKINDFKINELSLSYSLPKSMALIYRDSAKLFIGSEKNNNGGELFIIDMNNNIPISIIKSIEIDGQVNDIYYDNQVYIATAHDHELQVFDINGDKINTYNASLTLGNGKSVYYIYPYILLGRTVASFELNILSIHEGLLGLFNKYGLKGTLDYIEPLKNNYLLMTNYPQGELLFMDKNMQILGRVNIPSRVNSYTCIDETLLISNITNNKSHLIWLK